MTANQPDISAIRDFLDFTRSGPGFLFFNDRKQKLRSQAHFKDHNECIKLIKEKLPTTDCYVSMGDFGSSVVREAQYCIALNGFWIDIDSHLKKGEKGYRSVSDIEDQVDHFVSKHRLPKPSLTVRTGHGIHVHWVLTSPIPKAMWAIVSEPLNGLAKRELRADSITADAARVLRVANTYNFRDPEAPVLAVPKNRYGAKVNFSDFDEFRSAQLAQTTAGLTSYSSRHLNLPKAQLPRTQANEQVLEDMLGHLDPDPEDAGNYEDWRNICWSVAAIGWELRGYEIAKAWSATGDLYDEVTFDKIWSAYQPERDGGITPGTLVHLAKAAGYCGEGFSQSEPEQASNRVSSPFGRIVTTRASNIEPEAIVWLVDKAIPFGAVVLIGGEPGTGKSQTALKLAAAVTDSTVTLPDNSTCTTCGSVIVLANEDDAANTIRPRLEAAGADLNKVHIVQGVVREEHQAINLIQLDTDIHAIEQLVDDLGDVKMIIIDPPTAYLGDRADSYKDSDVRRLLTPLATLAQRTGILVLLVVHLNKRTEGSAQQRVGGSVAWTAVPRAAFLTFHDHLTGERSLLPAKNNLGSDCMGFSYKIEEAELVYPKTTILAPYIKWCGDVSMSADRLFGGGAAKRSSVDIAADFLMDALELGKQESGKIESDAAGKSISKSSLARARKQLGVKSVKDGSKWYMQLPEGITSNV